MVSCPLQRGNLSSGRLPPFRAVVMDMDGLALDTESTYCAAWERAAADLGFELNAEFCRGLFGRHADDVKAALAEACGDALDLQAFHALAEQHWLAFLRTRGVAKMPGLEHLLQTLRVRNVPYALATNSDEPYASLCLAAAEMGSAFPIVVTRDQVPFGKPAPDVFLEAARRLGVPAGDCLALEDSATGLAACVRAGMIPVWVPPRHSHPESALQEKVWVIRDLGLLAEWIEHQTSR